MAIVELPFVNRSGVEVKLKISSSTLSDYAFHHWKSAELLSQAFYSGHICVSGRQVLELGSGTGLCGISALKNGAVGVIFTDLDDPRIEDSIRRNCALNDIFDCLFVPCDWNDIPDLVLDKTFDMVIASDCLFDNAVVRPFAETLSLLLHKNSSTEAYIAYENRGSNIDLKSAFEKVGLSLVVQPCTIFDSSTFFLLKATTLHL